MLEVSELIYETCKTYLVTQGKFILLLELFVGTIIVALLRRAAAPRGVPGRHHPAVQPRRHCRQLRRGVVRHPGQHLRQLADGVCRPGGQALPRLRHPAQGGHEHRHAAHQRRAADHALHPAVHSRRIRRPVLHRLCHRRVAGRCGAAHRRRHLHQDRRHRVGPDEDRLQHQGRRRAQPGRHRRLHGRQRGRFGGPQRRRLRDLRGHRRRADHVHHAGRARGRRAGEAAGLDLHDARHDGRRQRPELLRERGRRQGAVPARGEDELRGAAHLAGVADLDCVGRADLRGLLRVDPGSGRRLALVEAVHRHHLRHAGRRDHPGAGEALHVHRVGARQGSRHLLARRRRVAQHPERPGRGQLQRLLAGHGHHGADGRRLLGERPGPGQPDEGRGGVCLRPGGLRLPGHGPGDHCRRLVRPGHRQRAVGVRAVDDRDASPT